MTRDRVNFLFSKNWLNFIWNVGVCQQVFIECPFRLTCIILNLPSSLLFMYISISSNWSKTNTRQTKTRPENYSPRHNFYLHICQLCQNARIILEIKKHFVFKILHFFNTIDTDFCALPIQIYWLQQKFKLNRIMLICRGKLVNNFAKCCQ